MNWQKNLPTLMKILCIISLIGAVLVFAIVLPNANAGYKKVLSSVIGVLLLILTLLIAYYLYVSRDAEPNFFLFDRNKKRNIAVEDLNFKIVNDRMNFFLTLVCENAVQLWQNGVLENESRLGYRRVYRPLLAYKMLFDLSERNIPVYWELLFNATPETVNSICGALEQAGEKEMVKAFRYVMDHYRATPEKIQDFIQGNNRYIRGRMVAYVKRNIELFY